MNSSALASFAAGDDLFTGCAWSAEGDVFEDGAAEEDGLLEDVADLVAEGLELVVADVVAVYEHVAGDGVVETGEEADDGGFAGPGGANDADELAGVDGEGDVGEDGLGGGRSRRRRAGARWRPEGSRVRGRPGFSGMMVSVSRISRTRSAPTVTWAMALVVVARSFYGFEEAGEVGE